MVDATSLRTSRVADLELIFHENTGDLRTLLALEAELDRRKTPRSSELRGKVRQQILSLNAVQVHGGTAKPWYRRGMVWLGGIVMAGVAQGILHAAGFHMWEPLWRAVQVVMPRL